MASIAEPLQNRQNNCTSQILNFWGFRAHNHFAHVLFSAKFNLDPCTASPMFDQRPQIGPNLEYLGPQMPTTSPINGKFDKGQ